MRRAASADHHGGSLEPCSRAVLAPKQFVGVGGDSRKHLLIESGEGDHALGVEALGRVDQLTVDGKAPLEERPIE